MRQQLVLQLGFTTIAAVICLSPEHAFGENKWYTLVPVSPRTGESLARGLNSYGHVAGRAGTGFGTDTAPLLWKHGKVELLTTPLPNEYGGGFGINDSGEVAGSANTATVLAPFVWSPTKGRVPLPLTPGDTGGQALAINNSGDVVGYTSGAGGMYAVLWKGSKAWQDPRVLPGGDNSRAFDINDSGEIAGTFSSSGRNHAALWSRDGELTDLGTLPGDVSSEAIGINNSGAVVGWSTAANGRTRAFLWTRQQSMKALGFLPGGDQSRALDISDSGEVVGTSTSSLGERAFVWTSADGMSDLNALIGPSAGIHLVEAHAINRNSQIVVLGIDRLDGHSDEAPTRVFLMMPAPGRTP